MHEKYADQGLAIVGVPCNQFGRQEPGTAEEIAEFCTSKYGVQFDLLEKVDVNGEDACPLYKWLTSAETNPKSPGPIQWNFEKFLFNRQGELVARFSPQDASPTRRKSSRRSKTNWRRNSICETLATGG